MQIMEMDHIRIISSYFFDKPFCRFSGTKTFSIGYPCFESMHPYIPFTVDFNGLVTFWCCSSSISNHTVMPFLLQRIIKIGRNSARTAVSTN